MTARLPVTKRKGDGMITNLVAMIRDEEGATMVEYGPFNNGKAQRHFAKSVSAAFDTLPAPAGKSTSRVAIRAQYKALRAP